MERDALTLNVKEAFFGRQAEWNILRQLLKETASGEPVSHIFCAGPGLGKSSLLKAFQGELASRGFRTLYLRPSAGLSKGHLEFVREAVLTLCGDGTLAEELDQTHVAYLEHIGFTVEHVQRLLRLWGPKAQRSRMTNEDEAFLTDDAIRQVFLLTARKYGLGLFVDDFGLCDQASRRFWLHLIQFVKKRSDRFQTKGLLLLTTTRQPAKASQCLGLDATGLDPLAAPACRQIICNLLQADEIPDVLFQFLFEKTQGNPRFLEALTQYLRTHDFLEVINRQGHLKRELASRKIPETLQALTEAKIEQCSFDTLTFLNYACLLQQPFAASLIALTTQNSLDTKTALWECEQKNILRQVDGKPDHWQFEQRRYREVIRARLSDGDTLTFRKKLATSLEKAPENTAHHHAEQLAMLYDAIGEAAKAELWYGRAAEHAYSGGQLEHAAQLYAACLERMERLWQPDAIKKETYHRGLKMFARMLSALNTFAPQKAIECTFDFLEKEAQENAPSFAAQICWQRARAYRLTSKHSDALEILNTADGLMRQAPLSPDLCVNVQLERAELLEQKGEMDRAQLALATVDNVIKNHPLNGRDLLWRHQNQKGRLLFKEHNFKPAKKAFEKARQMARANQNTVGESRALVNLAGTAWHLGQRHAAFLLLDKGEGLAKAAGDQIGCCRILLNRGFFFQAKNNNLDAHKCIQQALLFAESLDWPEGIAKAKRALKKLS